MTRLGFKGQSASPKIIAKDPHIKKVIARSAGEEPGDFSARFLQFGRNGTRPRDVAITGPLYAIKDFHLIKISML